MAGGGLGLEAGGVLGGATGAAGELVVGTAFAIACLV